MKRDGLNEQYPAAPAPRDPIQPGRPEDGFKPTDRHGTRKDWVDARNEMIQRAGAARAQERATAGSIGGKPK